MPRDMALIRDLPGEIAVYISSPGIIGKDLNEDLLAFCISVFTDILNIVEGEVHSCRVVLVNMNNEIV